MRYKKHKKIILLLLILASLCLLKPNNATAQYQNFSQTKTVAEQNAAYAKFAAEKAATVWANRQDKVKGVDAYCVIKTPDKFQAACIKIKVETDYDKATRPLFYQNDITSGCMDFARRTSYYYFVNNQYLILYTSSNGITDKYVAEVQANNFSQNQQIQEFSSDVGAYDDLKPCIYGYNLAIKEAEALSKEPPTPAAITPVLETTLPGLNFSTVGPALQNYYYIPWIGEYVAALFKYAIAIASILAVVLIIVQGIKIVVSVGGEQKTEAYKSIGRIVIGLIIAWCSYAILYIINPNLVTLKNVRVDYVTPIQYEAGGDSDGTDSKSNLDITQATTDHIDCPKKGGSDQIASTTNSMIGKVVYRFGGKGDGRFNEINTKYTKYNAIGCPQGYLCLDCSGLINYVYKCVGIEPMKGGTSYIFTEANGAEKIGSIDLMQNTVNGKPLKPGDLLGWKAGDRLPSANVAQTVGHVVMYIGNGKYIEAKGGDVGRTIGGNPSFRTGSQYMGDTKYGFTWVKRVSDVK